MKKLLGLFVFLTLITTSCDNLWKNTYQESVNVSFTIPQELIDSLLDEKNIDSNIQNSAQSSILQSVSTSITATAGLYNAENDELIAEIKDIDIGNNANDLIRFDNLYIIGTTVYAKIELIQYGYEPRSATSEPLEVMEGNNELTLIFQPAELATWTVTFDANGGEGTSTKSVTHNELAGLPDTSPTRTGYTFDGWYTSSNGGEYWGNDYPITGETTLYAQWNQNQAVYLEMNAPDGGDGTEYSPFNNFEDAKKGLLEGGDIYIIETFEPPQNEVWESDSGKPLILQPASFYDGTIINVTNNGFTLKNIEVTANRTTSTSALITTSGDVIDSLTLGEGVVISGNDNNGLINIPSASGTLNISGLVKVKSTEINGKSIVFTNNGTSSPIKLVGELSNGSEIGLSPGSTTDTFKLVMGVGYSPSAEDVAKFSFDDESITNQTPYIDSTNISLGNILDANGCTKVKVITKNSTEIEIIQDSHHNNKSLKETLDSLDKDLFTKITIIQPNNGKIIPNTDLTSLFSSYDSILTSIEGLEHIDMSQVTNMKSMFNSCSKLESIDISSWDTSMVSNMDYMFGSCNSLASIDLTFLETQNVVSMASMFSYIDNLNLIGFDTFDTAKVENMDNMFANSGIPASLTFSNLNTSSVTNMEGMFKSCKFSGNPDFSNFDTSNVTNMREMFYSCDIQTLAIGSWKTEKVTNMEAMFRSCDNITELDLTSWDTSKVTNMELMFAQSPNLQTLTIPNLVTPTTEIITQMFFYCEALTNIDHSSWDTQNVTGITQLFAKCSALLSLDLTGWQLTKVKNVYGLFNGCSNITSINLSNWNADNAELDQADAMFDGCTNLLRDNVNKTGASLASPINVKITALPTN